ncbi:MAG TPA: deoxyribodipyrimidine photolyase, partial [Minicystis sp.]|nr:deoxyribodipyrimidine photolyase [Minicystis sp.]
GAPLGALSVDRSVAPAALRGGERAARRALTDFVETRLSRYAKARDDPDAEATSRLSPWLHFGHLGAHEVLDAVLDHEGWTPDRLADKPRGDRAGFWGGSASAEAFLEQLVTWRELGFNACTYRDDYDRYGSLPDWALRTLALHARDPRPRLYAAGDLAAARTADPVWNAAQRELLETGTITNYLRMIWGKRVLEWTGSPEEALATLVALNDRYALDGRDPNSYSGIFWVFGRYDRPWGPERPIFGTVRYMSSERARKKLAMERYLERFSAGASR